MNKFACITCTFVWYCASDVSVNVEGVLDHLTQSVLK